MFGIRTRQLAAVLVASLASPVALMAQWGVANDCSCYNPAPAPVVTQSCQCLQPVTTMVSRQMQVTEYRQAQKVEKRPVQRMRMVSKSATAYRQVMDTKTVEVPHTTYQTVTEMVPRTINKSRWQTVTQPVPKMASCQYDNRPGMMAAMNRMGYTMRSSLQPNFVTHRQFIPQVCQCNVPVQRQVAVPSTRQVTYNVARMEPYQTTQQVAEYYTDYENVTVTTMEPVSVMKTVQVPTTRMAFVDPYTGTAAAPQETQTAKEPTPVREAENNTPPVNGNFKESSIRKPESTSVADTRPMHRSKLAPTQPVRQKAQSTVASTGSDGWKAHAPAANQLTGPKLVTGKNTVVSK